MKRRSSELAVWALMLIIVAVVAAYATLKPLPGNLEQLAVSPRAIDRLKEANR
jgi:hypothetical protein